uniref:Reverse transcriptase/retrotransposon-derived protein RNase H-like domain-containing protein n=1 Tax=Chelonoidis abingdonii TaxID=106734 RepID=A0A8C0GZJ2_CHEAB
LHPWCVYSSQAHRAPNLYSFCWSPEADRAFKILKRKLMEAPALGLPDLSKPFQLNVHERKGVALGVLTQLLGTWKRPVAYFSKQLDQVAKGWPACLRAVAATALVLEEPEKNRLLVLTGLDLRRTKSPSSALGSQINLCFASPSRCVYWH